VKSVKSRIPGRKLFWLNVILFLVPVIYFTYGFALAAIGRGLVVDEAPGPSDAIVVLAGGEPGRAFSAVDLYKAGLARFVVITTELSPSIFERAKKDGIDLVPTYENYARVLKGYGVPDENIMRIEEQSSDTFEEIQRVGEFARKRGWTRLIIVTSNYHTRRARMVADYLLEPEIHVAVSASRFDKFQPDAWWTSQAQARTFAIEVQKLLTYTLYIWPRKLWKTRESTNPRNTSSVSWGLFSTQPC